MSGIDPTATMGLARASEQADVGSRLTDRMRQAAESGDAEGLGEAARQFEAYFVSTMLKEMRKTSGGEHGLFAGSEMETFHGLFDQEIAGRISEGEGIGLARMIERSMAEAGASRRLAGLEAYGVGGARVRRHHVPALAFPEGRDGFSWPLPDTAPGRISSGFGHRSDPFSGASRDHGGLDIAAPRGTPVLSLAQGRVVRSDWSSSFGNVVEIEHADGVRSRYAHQDRLDVRVGDQVEAGEQIGAVGSTGRSTGDHLHLEVHVKGRAVDPHAFLDGSSEQK